MHLHILRHGFRIFFHRVHPAAEHDIIRAPLVQKIVTDLRYNPYIIRVHALKHTYLEPRKGILAVQSGIADESVGREDWHSLMIYILIINERKRTAFICFFHVFRELVHDSLLHLISARRFLMI